MLFAMVFGGYVLSGGHFEVILHALPHEMMTIGGAAAAALPLAGFHLRHAAHDDHEPRRPAPSRDGDGEAAGKASAAHALTTMADGLPALGIVAAVLGVIKTMGSITEPPEILGSMVGGALVGTFLGVFLAYGLVGPIATRLKGIVDEEAQF